MICDFSLNYSNWFCERNWLIENVWLKRMLCVLIGYRSFSRELSLIFQGKLESWSILSVCNESNSILFIWLLKTWVVWASFMMLLCPFWSLKACILCSTKECHAGIECYIMSIFVFWMNCLKPGLPSRVLVLRQCFHWFWKRNQQ